MQHVLIVGAGVTAGALVARLRQLCPAVHATVLESRPHAAGNCYDELADHGTRVHRYGPHLFHSPSARIVDFCTHFTEWTPVQHSVTAEIEFDGELRHVPFPYSLQTEGALRRSLNASVIVDTFYRGYSQKMWGRDWDELPKSVQKRVPANASAVPERSNYFPGEFVALPRDGYTSMIMRMFEGCEMHLGVGANDWLGIDADEIVYTGRPDLIRIPGYGSTTLGEALGCSLQYRTIDLRFVDTDWAHGTAVLNVCHLRDLCTRRTCYRLLTGGASSLVSEEFPRAATPDELAPFYPITNTGNRNALAALTAVISQHFPRLTFAGRLGVHRYLDMYQAIGNGIAVAERLAQGF